MHSIVKHQLNNAYVIKNIITEIVAKLLHILPHIHYLDIILATKCNAARQTTDGHGIRNNNKIHPTIKVSSDKIGISHLCPKCYFNEDTTYAILFREMVFIN
jgi:hypothetical protein